MRFCRTMAPSPRLLVKRAEPAGEEDAKEASTPAPPVETKSGSTTAPTPTTTKGNKNELKNKLFKNLKKKKG